MSTRAAFLRGARPVRRGSAGGTQRTGRTTGAGTAPTSRRTSCLRPSVLSRPRLSRGAEPVCEELVRVAVDGEDASNLVCRANFFVLLETKHYINTSVRVRAKLSDRPTPPAIIEPRDHRITNIKGCACLTSACCHDWRHGPDGEPPAKPSCSSRPRVLEGSRVESGSPRPPTPRYAPWRVSWGRGMCSSWPSELPRSRTRAYCGRCAADCAQDSEPQKAQAGCKL